MLQFTRYFLGAAKVAAFCLFSLACLMAAENAAAAGTGETEKTPPTLSAVRAIDGFALRAAYQAKVGPEAEKYLNSQCWLRPYRNSTALEQLETQNP